MPLGARRSTLLARRRRSSPSRASAATTSPATPRDEEAVAHLRARKHREEKPLAVMTRDPRAARRDLARPSGRCSCRPRGRSCSSRRRHGRAGRRRRRARTRRGSGVMLPYTPLHHLLCADFGGPLVMTSGNRSDEPIAFEDGDARAPARRHRGRVPDARPRRSTAAATTRSCAGRRSRSAARAATRRRRSLPVPRRRPIARSRARELKSTFCVARGRRRLPLRRTSATSTTSPPYRAFTPTSRSTWRCSGSSPDGSRTTSTPTTCRPSGRSSRDAALVAVQHHHAHAAACLADHGEDGPALALVFDGTGYGTDGTLWGGEFLRCDLARLRARRPPRPVPLPAARRRSASPGGWRRPHLERAGLDVPWGRWRVVRESLKLNAPLASGMGRLFDAVAAAARRPRRR